ncbi:MAG: DUF29 domain-containing protein [Gemmataceae bacterium]|nr:DUF29 domain-containing protein [Gemmataceae bacterium]
MTTTELVPLRLLYEQDETAWLETMSALAAEGRLAEMDFTNLSEYLADMAKRDRREVKNRLVVLLQHLLKWECQPNHRSGSWKATIMEQRRILEDMLDSGTLHNHAEAILAKTYDRAREEAAAETELPLDSFPQSCPWDLESLLTARQ